MSSASRLADRKASYKSPPAHLSDPRASQEARRKKALEEQKRRRAERFDSSRQLDLFADLNLGPSDDERDEDDNTTVNVGPEIIREGIASFAPMLPPADVGTSAVEIPIKTSESIPPEQESDVQTNGKKRTKKKRKGKGRQSQKATQNQKLGKWADKCMYAELLEMSDESDLFHEDGIPSDLESGWVAVAPVPSGKRCMVITHAASGIAGLVPNTTIRSRVLGKPLMKPFPSSLPPHTVLDCILDANWKLNGIVHVLDVLTWKGQDIGDCETPFRFWWRDTRLSELPVFPPASDVNASRTDGAKIHFQFAYPVNFTPIPYHTNTTISRFVDELIPLTRSTRRISIQVPNINSAGMDLDTPTQELQDVEVNIGSDGILLYLSQASYEPGTSPLSLWVPIRPFVEWKDKDQDHMDVSSSESPLGQFERLLRKRLSRSPGARGSEPVEVEMT
ncbi:hypothetical protein QCA50_013764 [Cerrena zonata]|uniref:Snurportin-1 n=1 Tax=Cerrena zonata TaxID=2478898 RepID=A0AAW0FQP9_9APHY